MKGLLYKDGRILATSFRTLPLMVFIFLLVSVFNENGSFWSMYGIFMGCTMISTLQNLDETSKWCTFCDTLPLNRSDLVTEKYILGLIVTAVSVAVLVVLRIGFGLFGIGNGFNGLGRDRLFFDHPDDRISLRPAEKPDRPSCRDRCHGHRLYVDHQLCAGVPGLACRTACGDPVTAGYHPATWICISLFQNLLYRL